MPENHPFSDFENPETMFRGGFIPRNAKIIIVGTFPPENEYIEKGEGYFFYSSERNHLWNRIDNIFPNTNLKKTSKSNHLETFTENRNRKMQFCVNNGIGFIDVFTVVERNFIGATKDSDLIPIENIGENGTLKSLILEHNIVRICCVYSLAYNTMLTALGNIGASIGTFPNVHSANGIMHNVHLMGKDFELVLLYAATRSPETREMKDTQYAHFLMQ